MSLRLVSRTLEPCFSTSAKGGFFHYYAYSLADAALRPVLAPRDVHQPIAGLIRQSANGGLLAVAAATAGRPSEVYTCAGDGPGAAS